MSSSQQTNEASRINAIKDQAVGTIKEAIGSVLGNNTMELEGKAQKVHGKIEYQYAKALKDGEVEPEKFHQAYHVPSDFESSQEPNNSQPHSVPIAGQAPPPPPDFVSHAPIPPAPAQHVSTQPSQGEPSQMSGWKDQAVGSIKESWGSATNNNQMEMAGKAQQMHGRNEAEFAKANKEHLNEPEHFVQGTKTTEHAQGEVVEQEPSKMSGWKDQAVGAMKSTFGSATNNQEMELKGKAQSVHGRNEAEFAKAKNQGLDEPEHFGQERVEHAKGSVEGDSVSTLGALKDKALGSVKETFGSMTGNQNMELKGKAQNMHGRNEAEFVKAQKEGLSEPEHFAHGKKAPNAEGQIVSEEPSKMSGWKDQAVGAMKSTFGSATNNQEMELKGKAQSVHGRNEAEFAKAKNQGLDEPEHFGQGKKTEHSEGTVEGEKVSSMSAMKDKAIGTLKENWGSATGNTNTELAGKAQQMHGRNEAEFVKAQKQGLREPEHFVQGTKTTEHAQGEVVEQEPSKVSGWKDQTVGSMKETFGSMTNNQKLELEGKAQKMQGSNACSQADAKRNTINA